jgi:hypothetical protein
MPPDLAFPPPLTEPKASKTEPSTVTILGLF